MNPRPLKAAQRYKRQRLVKNGRLQGRRGYLDPWWTVPRTVSGRIIEKPREPLRRSKRLAKRMSLRNTLPANALKIKTNIIRRRGRGKPKKNNLKTNPVVLKRFSEAYQVLLSEDCMRCAKCNSTTKCPQIVVSANLNRDGDKDEYNYETTSLTHIIHNTEPPPINNNLDQAMKDLNFNDGFFWYSGAPESNLDSKSNFEFYQ